MVKLIASFVCVTLACGCSAPDTRAHDDSPPAQQPAPGDDNGIDLPPEPPSPDPCQPQERAIDLGDAGRLTLYVYTACGDDSPLDQIRVNEGDPYPGLREKH